ncbi:beta strand repeat-containing protein [Actinoplanes rectilineatus]|uniref:beta strand repeat-containing protein n=1 Tax=Actinoplanes rectilineatus TaxID=113571 RepID=UPI0005F2D86C|nr:hypothetical protein [Actinoplanes rectilineatus]
MRRWVAIVVVAAVAVATSGRSAVLAASNSYATSAQALRLSLNVLNGVVPLTLNSPNAAQTWVDGGPTATQSVANGGLNALGVSVLNLGAVTATAGPATSGGGGRAQADVAGLGLLGAAGISTGAIKTSCVVNSSGITTTVDIANLKLGGSPILNPDANLKLNLPGLASVTIDKRTATWNTSTGKFDYNVRALDVGLLNGALGVIANGSVVVAESVCSGTIKLGTITTTPVALAPGESGTATVTVTNVGDTGAQNTTVKIPQPPATYVVDLPTSTGGGTCSTADPAYIVCTGVTVPGTGNAKISLPVRLKASAASNTAAWAPAVGTISGTSVPVPQAPTATMEITGGGTLATGLARKSLSGTVTTTPVTLPAGKIVTPRLTVANAGPSDALTTITIPLTSLPAGVTVESATAGGTACTVTGSIVCSGITVPGGGSVAVDLSTSASLAAAVNATWDVSGVTAPLNGTAVTGAGRLLTIGYPDVNLTGGVTITPATATPGGAPATATIQVANSGAAASQSTTITIPAPPSGYTVGTVTSTNGGTCVTATSGVTTCTGVTVPAGKSTTISVPVTLASGATATWAAATGTPVTATAGPAGGTATGTIVTPAPRYTLGVTADVPAEGTVSPGQTASVTAKVYNQGPSDAKQGKFVVVAPNNTSFGPLTGTAATLCSTTLLNLQLNCAADIPADGTGVSLTLPLVVSPLADPSTPVTGGCFSVDGDSACGASPDVKIPAIVLRSGLATRLSTTFTPATITPGATGTGTLTLTSSKAETALNAAISTLLLPSGFTITSATVPGGTCVTGGTALTCTGITLAAGVGKDIAVRITVDPATIAPKAWAPSVTLTTANETTLAAGPLAGTGTVSYTLAATATAPADGTVEPGGDTTMTFGVTNSGPSNAPLATFSVVAPVGTSFGTLTGQAATVCKLSIGSMLLCSANLPANATTGTLTVPLKVAANADVDKAVTGGCVDVNGIPGCDSADRAIPAFTLRVPFAAQAALSADRADVTPGSTATATVHVTAPRNELTGTALTVPLAALPAGLTATAVTGPSGASCALTASQAGCSGLTIAKGASADVTLTVAAASSAATGTSWTAAGVTVAAGGQSITSSPELARVTGAKPNLDASLSLNVGSLLPGGGGLLGVNLVNTGPSDATNTPVNVIAPLGTTIGTLTGATAGACTVAASTTLASCTVNLAAGDPALSLSVPLQVGLNVLPGKAVTSGCVDLDADGACTAAVDKLIPNLTVAVPLQLRTTVTTTPARIKPGQDGDAKVTLTSTGAESGLTVTVPTTGMPAGASVTAASVPTGTCTLGSPVTCTGISLTAGTPTAVTLKVASASSGSAGLWTAVGIGVKNATESAVAAGPLAVVEPPVSTLTGAVTVPASGTVGLGGVADLAVDVTNTGPSDAKPAVFTVTAPLGTTLGTVPSGCLNALGLAAVCSMPLAAGASTGPLTFPVNVPAGADPFTALTGGCVSLDGVAGCGTGDKVIPDISLAVPLERALTVQADPVTVVPGRSDDATLRLTGGKTPLDDLVVTVPVSGLPSGLTLDAVTPDSGSCLQAAAGLPYVCTGVDVASGTVAPIKLDLTADPGATPGGVWNAAGITTGLGADLLTTTKQLATVGLPDIDLVPVVTTPGPIDPGKTGTLGVTLTNDGDSNAVGVAVGVIPPVGVTVGAPPAGCAANAGTGGLTCVTDLLAGATGAVTSIPLVVDPGASPGKTLTGGCVDLDNDGHCLAPPDVTIGPIAVSTPFDRQVSVHTAPVTIAPGDTGTAGLLIDALQGQSQPLSITVPVGNLPPTMQIGTPTVDQGGTCVTGTGTITCSGIDLSAPGVATVSIPVTVDAAAPTDQVWGVTGSQVLNALSEAVGGSGVLVNTGVVPYLLGALVDVPADDTVLPGTTALVKAVVDNTGTGLADAVPVTALAPAGTTFDPNALPAGCTSLTSTALSCGITLNTGDSATLNLPIAVPNPAPASTITGGCLDLGGDGKCDPADVKIGDFDLREPLTDVLSLVSAAPATITPGKTGIASVQLGTTLDRDDLKLTVDPAGLPGGLAVTAATVAGAGCTVTAGAVSCPDVDIAGGDIAKLNLTLAADPAAHPGDTWAPAITLAQGLTDTTVLKNLVATVGAADNGSGLSVPVTVPADGTVLPGTSADLRISMINPGPSLLPHALAAIKAPDGTTFGVLDAPASGLCAKDSSTLVTCVTDLAVGALPFRLPLDIPATTTPGSTISGGCLDLNVDGVCGSPDTPLPAFDLGKPFGAQAQVSLEPGTIVPGGTGTGVLRLTADRALSGLTATVPLTGLPTGLTVTGATGPAGSICTLAGAIVCTGVTAPNATTDLVTVALKAASSMPGDVAWTPPAVTVTNAAGDVAETVGTLIRTGTPVSDLKYAITAPAGTIAPGGTAALTVGVTNAGPSDALAAVTRIKAPAGTTFGDLTGTTAQDCATVGVTQLDCTVNLAPGAPALQWQLPVQVPANADPDTDLSGGCVDTNRDSTCGAGETLLPTLHLTPTLAQGLTVTVPNPPTIQPGRTGSVGVDLTATRARTGLAVSVPLVSLPAGMAITGAQAPGAVCGLDLVTVTCTGVDVKAGGTTTVTLNTTVLGTAAPGDTWTPTATVTEGLQSVSRTLTAATIGDADTDVTVDVTAPLAGLLNPGDAGELAVTVANAGSSTAHDVTYTFLAPAGAVFTPPAGTTASLCAVGASGAATTCTVDVGGNAKVRLPLPFAVSPTADPRIPLTGGCVDLDEDSACTLADTAIPVVTLAVPLLGRLTVDGVPATVVPGRSGTGVIRVTSTGALTAATIAIPLTGLPSGVTVTAAGGPEGSACVLTPALVTCTGIDLAAGKNNAVSVITQVAGTVAPGVTWTPSGITVTAGGQVVTGSAALTTVADRSSKVTWTITGTGGTATPGATKTITATATNYGPSDARDGKVTVVAPTSTTFGALTGTIAQYCQAVPGNRLLTCAYNLDVGSSVSWALPLVVDPTLEEGVEIGDGCLSTDGNTTCDQGDTGFGRTTVDQPLREKATLTLTPAVVKPGGKGTAKVTMSTTTGFSSLSLTVPLTTLPAEISLTSAAIGGDTCTIAKDAVRCTRIALAAGTPRTLNLGVTLARSTENSEDPPTWQVTGVTLVEPADPADQVTVAGVLVSTDRTSTAVSVAVGAPSVATPARGETTVLPITLSNSGTGAAVAYPVTAVLPQGTTRGTLPAGCTAGSTARIVTCTVNVAAGGTTRIALPVVVGTGATPGSTLSGGCLDSALATGTPVFDLACGGKTDVALPSLKVKQFPVDLSLQYSGGTVSATNGGSVLLRVDYGNKGTQTAKDVEFLLVPPAATTVQRVEIVGDTDESTASIASATTATCTAATDVAAGAVRCVGPDSAAESGSQLLVTLKVGTVEKAGVHALKITVSTVDDDGNAADNALEVPMRLAAADSDDETAGEDEDDGGSTDESDGTGSDDASLATTGAKVTGMATLAVLALAGGAGILLLVRGNDPLTVSDNRFRHARDPQTRFRHAARRTRR